MIKVGARGFVTVYVSSTDKIYPYCLYLGWPVPSSRYTSAQEPWLLGPFCLLQSMWSWTSTWHVWVISSSSEKLRQLTKLRKSVKWLLKLFRWKVSPPNISPGKYSSGSYCLWLHFKARAGLTQKRWVHSQKLFSSAQTSVPIWGRNPLTPTVLSAGPAWQKDTAGGAAGSLVTHSA